LKLQVGNTVEKYRR